MYYIPKFTSVSVPTEMEGRDRFKY